MRVGRILKHLLLPDWWVRRPLPKRTVLAIERAVAESERRHCGELRFVFDATLPLNDLWHDLPARESAVDAFSRWRVWDTEHNSGVLIYVQMLDRRVEIVADRGIDARVDEDYWRRVCERMEAFFARGEFEAGCLVALKEITETLATHFPASANDVNELLDRPIVH